MESILWAVDMLAVAYLCLWALKQDKRKDQAAREGKQPDA